MDVERREMKCAVNYYIKRDEAVLMSRAMLEADPCVKDHEVRLNSN